MSNKYLKKLKIKSFLHDKYQENFYEDPYTEHDEYGKAKKQFYAVKTLCTRDDDQAFKLVGSWDVFEELLIMQVFNFFSDRYKGERKNLYDLYIELKQSEFICPKEIFNKTKKYFA